MCRLKSTFQPARSRSHSSFIQCTTICSIGCLGLFFPWAQSSKYPCFSPIANYYIYIDNKGIADLSDTGDGTNFLVLNKEFEREVTKQQ
jgi:hypothetical protein